MTQPKPKRENLLLNIIFNVLAPILILTKAADYVDINPTVVLCIAIALPLGYGIYDYITRKKLNMLSALGLANVLVTGFIGLAELDSKWIAVKEASFPLMIGFAVLASMRTRNPLVRTFLYNDQVLDVKKIENELDARTNRPAFEALLNRATYILVASFLLSAVLNYFLAKIIVTSSGGTDEFNEQIGKMNGLSWIVIVIPTTIISGYALYLLISGIKRLTGLGLEEVIHSK